MKNWADIQGHPRAMDVLERAMNSGRMHHAYLFTGPEGVGKFTLAHTLSAIINCPRRPEGQFQEACQECSSCRKIRQEQHPDILFVRPQGRNIKIDQIRTVQKSASTQPFEARERVVLIDDAHTMTEEASNALLKTLEEPSTRMRLILVTDQVHKLLDTILSRCQRIPFGFVEHGAVVAIVAKELENDRPAEKKGTKAAEAAPTPVDMQTVAVAASYSEGSPGKALAMLRSGMLQERENLLRMITGLHPQRPAALLDLAESLGKGNTELEEQLDILKLFLRDVMLYKASPQTGRLVNRDLAALVEQFAKPRGTGEVVDLIERVGRAQELIARNVNPQLILEDLLRHIVAPGAAGRS